MTRSPFISTGRQQREWAARRRRRRARLRVLAVVVLALGVALVIARRVNLDQPATRANTAARARGASGATGHRGRASTAHGGTPHRTSPQLAPLPATPTPAGPTAAPLVLRVEGGHTPVHLPFKVPPRSGLMFNLRTGRVLWQRHPILPLPIASLTKMMTAYLVVRSASAHAPVRITRQALAYHGSGVGVLPRGRNVAVETLLNGLLLPSGNDAAIALAQHVGGTVGRFLARMNDTAGRLGLRCTHFASVDGFSDAGRSCAADLAVLARADLDQPRLARIVRRPRAVEPLPIKGGKVYLYNNNPLIRLHYPGVDGLKTGYTNAAGHCLVATARRHGISLGVVLLHSPDTGRQASQLLNQGFRIK